MTSMLNLGETIDLSIEGSFMLWLIIGVLSPLEPTPARPDF